MFGIPTELILLVVVSCAAVLVGNIGYSLTSSWLTTSETRVSRSQPSGAARTQPPIAFNSMSSEELAGNVAGATSSSIAEVPDHESSIDDDGRQIVTAHVVDPTVADVESSSDVEASQEHVTTIAAD